MRQTSSLTVHSISLDAIRTLRPLLERIERRDRNLADQIRRAATSVALNIAEGDASIGGNRRVRFASARASSREVRSALAVAVAWGYVNESACEELDAMFDRVSAMLYPLTR